MKLHRISGWRFDEMLVEKFLSQISWQLRYKYVVEIHWHHNVQLNDQFGGPLYKHLKEDLYETTKE